MNFNINKCNFHLASALNKGCCIDRKLIGYFSSEMSTYKILCPFYRYIYIYLLIKHIYIRENSKQITFVDIFMFV